MNSAVAETNRREPDDSVGLKGVLIYEDFETGLAARHTLDGIIQAFEQPADCQASLWRFDLFVEPAVRLEAADAAADADLVVVSVHGHRELSPPAKSWFAEWFGREGKRPTALVVLLELDALHTPVADRMLDELSTSAERAGVGLFIHPADAQLRWTSTVEDIHHRAETHTWVVDQSADFADPPAYSHWGINE